MGPFCFVRSVNKEQASSLPLACPFLPNPTLELEGGGSEERNVEKRQKGKRKRGKEEEQGREKGGGLRTVCAPTTLPLKTLTPSLIIAILPTTHPSSMTTCSPIDAAWMVQFWPMWVWEEMVRG